MSDDNSRGRLYTLAEAKQKLAEIDCERGGHDLNQHLMRNGLGDVVINRVYCDRCKVNFVPEPDIRFAPVRGT